MGLFSYFTEGMSVEVGSYHTRIMKNGKLLLDMPSIVEYREKHEEKRCHYISAGYGYVQRPRHDATIKYLWPVVGILADFQACVFMMSEFKRRLQTSVPRRFLVATPAYATEVDRRAYKEAIEMAFGRVSGKQYAVSAPIAAVVGLGYDVFDDSVVHCIVDVGHGMNSVSLVCGGKLLAVNKCGEAGKAFDNKVIEYYKTNGLLIIEPSTALNAKELLPGGENECVVSCINLKTGVTEYRTFERNEVEYWFDSSYKKLVECLKDCMEEKSITEKPIKYHLIGGASQTIGLKEYMEKATKCSFSMPNEPDKVIIKGLDLLNTKPYIKHLSECGSLF